MFFFANQNQIPVKMIFKSKLDAFVSQYIGSVREKSLFFRKNFPSILALLLFGFLVGNVFGTFLNTLRVFFLWDVFIIFILIGLLEILNYNVYHARNRLLFLSPSRRNVVPASRFATSKRNVVPAKIVVQFLNFFKIGLMIGFFVDAFKVGS
jgi:hypothetical protein